MKKIKVAAAVIHDSGRILATQRGYGNYKGFWEFPGGKIEEGETPEEALIREIREELKAEIVIEEQFETVEHDYPEFHVSLFCFLSTLKDGEMTLTEHEDAKWLDRSELDSVKWLGADYPIIEKLKTML